MVYNRLRWGARWFRFTPQLVVHAFPAELIGLRHDVLAASRRLVTRRISVGEALMALGMEASLFGRLTPGDPPRRCLVATTWFLMEDRHWRWILEVGGGETPFPATELAVFVFVPRLGTRTSFGALETVAAPHAHRARSCGVALGHLWLGARCTCSLLAHTAETSAAFKTDKW
ncbi:hypothetical protein NDU88_001526 [Pleurodeles waltl]|uniref:Uncharacterized protein n=1 Tax=Pleurodeles waltl TaxID=8319 RepID=A0AAV7U7F4_PLEWA|nr:hypothetical protein NDU88_001526 [Pleurodeles waltl]